MKNFHVQFIKALMRKKDLRTGDKLLPPEMMIQLTEEYMWHQGPVSIKRPSYLGMAIPMLKIRRPLGRLIFNMVIAIPGETVFLIETAPWLRWVN